MTVDKVYQKQLEQFGVESVRLTSKDINKRLRKEQRQNTLLVMKTLMDVPSGRQWVYEQLDLCQVFGSPFIPGQSDVTNVLCGVQLIGHKLLTDIMEAAPEQFYIMNQEAGARRSGAASINEDLA